MDGSERQRTVYRGVKGLGDCIVLRTWGEDKVLLIKADLWQTFGSHAFIFLPDDRVNVYINVTLGFVERILSARPMRRISMVKSDLFERMKKKNEDKMAFGV